MVLWKVFPMEEIVAKYKSGISIMRLASAYNSDMITIRKHMVKEGVQIRSQQESISNYKCENNPNWKGDNATTGAAFHEWLKHNYGKPDHCEKCGLSNPKRRYEWANLNSHVYRRIREDYKMLCVSCHRNLDMTDERRNKCRIGNLGKKFTPERLANFKSVVGTPEHKAKMRLVMLEYYQKKREGICTKESC